MATTVAALQDGMTEDRPVPDLGKSYLPGRPVPGTEQIKDKFVGGQNFGEGLQLLVSGYSDRIPMSEGNPK